MVNGGESNNKARPECGEDLVISPSLLIKTSLLKLGESKVRNRRVSTNGFGKW